MSRTIELDNIKHILLTGRPGCGKTTLVIKVCEMLVNMKLPVVGFYTKEIRSGNSRTGFDVYSLDNKHGPLARISSDQNYTSTNKFTPKVGNYAVDLQSFESIALPSLSIQDKSMPPVMVIDEIGKMEMFSRNFESKVKELFNNKNLIILATVPNKGKPIPLVEMIKKLPTAALIEVDFNNRDTLCDKIANCIKNTYTNVNK